MGIIDFIPIVKGPDKELSFQDRKKWTVVILIIFFVMLNIYPVAIPLLHAAGPPLILTSYSSLLVLGEVGIVPIVLVGFFTLLLSGLGVIKPDLSPNGRVRFDRMQKFFMLIVAFLWSAFSVFGWISGSISALTLFLLAQLLLGSIAVIYLNDIAHEYAITSGINLLLLEEFLYILFLRTIYTISAVVSTQAGSTGALFLQQLMISLAPTILIAIMFLVCLYLYKDLKVQLKVVYEEMKGVGEKMPIYFLFISIFATLLATTLIALLQTVGSATLRQQTSSFFSFLASYQQVSNHSILSGGLLYLITPSFPLLADTSLGGIGTYPIYLTYLSSHTILLPLPFGGMVWVPEWVHVVVHVAAFLLLTLLFTRIWVRLLSKNLKLIDDEKEKEFIRGSIYISLLASLSISLFGLSSPIAAAAIFYVVHTQYKEQKQLAKRQH